MDCRTPCNSQRRNTGTIWCCAAPARWSRPNPSRLPTSAEASAAISFVCQAWDPGRCPLSPGGRAAWNVVTTSNANAALNFNLDAHIAHELRYERANEFVDVVRGLWDCWQDGAVVADTATGRYIDAAKVAALNHEGRFFKVRGP